MSCQSQSYMGWVISSTNQRFIFFILMTIFWHSSASQTDLSRVDLENGYYLNADAKVFSTPNDITADEALKAIDLNQLEIANSPIAPGFTTNYFWVLLEFQSPEEAKYLIEMINPHIDYYNLFKINHREIEELFRGGDRYPFNERFIEYRNFMMPVTLEKGSNRFLIRLDKRNSSLRFPLKLWRTRDFEKHVYLEEIYYGIIFGLIGVAVVISLIFSILFRSFLFGSYSLYSLLMGLHIFSTLGYSYQFLYPEYDLVNDYFRVFLVIVNMGAGSFFFTRFLQMSTYCPKRLRIVNGVVLSSFCILVIWMLFPDFVRQQGVIFLNIILLQDMVLMAIFITTAFAIYPYERRDAIVFFTWSVFVVGGMMTFILMDYGLLDPSLFFIEPMAIGFCLEIIVLAISMMAKLNGIVEINKHALAIEAIAGVQIENSLSNLEVCYIKSIGHYLEIHHEGSNKPKIVRGKKNTIISKLSKNALIKTHRSYLVNPAQIKMRYADKLVLRNGAEIPISRSFKSNLGGTLLKG